MGLAGTVLLGLLVGQVHGAQVGSGVVGGSARADRDPPACWLRRECKSAEVASSAEREPVLGEGNEAALKMHGDIYHFSDLIFN